LRKAQSLATLKESRPRQATAEQSAAWLRHTSSKSLRVKRGRFRALAKTECRGILREVAQVQNPELCGHSTSFAASQLVQIQEPHDLGIKWRMRVPLEASSHLHHKRRECPSPRDVSLKRKSRNTEHRSHRSIPNTAVKDRSVTRSVA